MGQIGTRISQYLSRGLEGASLCHNAIAARRGQMGQINGVKKVYNMCFLWTCQFG